MNQTVVLKLCIFYVFVSQTNQPLFLLKHNVDILPYHKTDNNNKEDNVYAIRI